MADDKPTLTRRRVLGGMATIGAAGAVGAGTTALFNDEEGTGDLTFSTGSVDLQVDYDYDSTKGGTTQDEDSGTLDGSGSPFNCNLTDLKPGDSVKIEFCPEVFDNPSYVWIGGQLTGNVDLGLTEPEEAADDSSGSGDGSGELAEALNVVVKYEGGSEIESGNLSAVMSAINGGTLLSGDRESGAYSSGGDQDGSSMSGSPGKCIVFDIDLPKETGNTVQSDEVTFEVVFHAEQERNNSSPDYPGNTSGA